MHLQDTVENMGKDGFTNIGRVITDEQLARLRKIVDDLLAGSSVTIKEWRKKRNSNRYETAVLQADRCTIVTNVIGASAELDEMLEFVLSHREVKSQLEAVLGTGYKLQNAGIRRSEPGDIGLGFHQDARGELGLSIALFEEEDFEGATVFVPGTHMLPITIRELMVYPNLWIRGIPRKFLKGAVGKAGDIFFFYNRTWHGRYPRKRNYPVTVISLSLLAVGAKFQWHVPPPDLLQRLGPELRRLLAEEGVKPVGNGYYEVVAAGSWVPPANERLKKTVTAKFSRSAPLDAWAHVTNLATTRLIGLSRRIRG